MRWSPHRRFISEYISKYDLPDKKILLIGTGLKFLNRDVSIKKYANAISIDLDKDAKPNIVCDSISLPFLSNSFDYILALENIQYWGDYGAGISEIRRVIKPGGELLLSLPVIHPFEGGSDSFRFSIDKIIKELEVRGFGILEVVLSGKFQASIKQLDYYRRQKFFNPVASLLLYLYNLCLFLSIKRKGNYLHDKVVLGYLIKGRKVNA